VGPRVVVQENDAFGEHPAQSLNFLHNSVTQLSTYNVITVHTTESTVNLGRALSFCVKKTNHSTYHTAGGSGDDIVHVSSVITPTLRSENV
jgi:hypothetical protein